MPQSVKKMQRARSKTVYGKQDNDDTIEAHADIFIVDNDSRQNEQVPFANGMAIPMTDLPTEGNDDPQPASAFVDAEQSSFEETLGAIANTDDPNMLCLTVRSLICSLFLILIYSILNHYAKYRTQSYTLSSTLVVGLLYPIGHFLAWLLPKRLWFEGRRYEFTFNPGPFTMKEHTLIYNMVWISGIDIVPVYIFPQLQILSSSSGNDMPHYAVGLLFVLSAQLIGFSLAGVLRRLFVWPSEMVWPWNLPYLVTIRTLHEVESPFTAKWLGLTRRRFFVILLIITFCYQWVSRFMFTMLGVFPWWCLINQNSIVLSQLTGPRAFSIGLFPLDWSVISNVLRTPIIVPAWAHINIAISFILIGWVLIPVLYYTNVVGWARLPVTGTINYRVISGSKLTQKTVTHAVVTYFYFGAVLALFLHTILFHSRTMIKYIRTSLNNRQNDVHCTLIGKYKEVSGWIYSILFVITLITACLSCHFSKLMPWYYVLVAVGFVIVYIVPSNILWAQTGVYIDPNLIIYIIGGLIFQNQQMAHITFFTFTWGMQDQTSVILQNLKLAHYMKIAPRSMFIVQLVATIVSSTSAYIVTRYLTENITGFCTTNTEWSCSYMKSFYSFFPRTDFNEMYGMKSVYPWLLSITIIVAVMPFFVWLARHFFPNIHWLRYVHIPILFVYLRNLENPAGGYLQLPAWILIGLIFRIFIHRWWFHRYGFLCSLTLTMGDRFARLFMYFIFINRNTNFPTWWGTTNNLCPLSNANTNGTLLPPSDD